MKRGVLGFVLLGFVISAAAQNYPPEPSPLYDDSRLATIRISIDPVLLNAILAPGNEESEVEHPAVFEYDDGVTVETVNNVGFRLRGNTSRFSAKKSFKVSFNAFERGKRFLGVEKLNLNGEHNDPTIIRSKLAWDLFAEQGVIATRAAHVRLFINEVYFGLYANVEHVDEQFLMSRFGDDSGNLYRSLWPADLRYLGPDAADYYPDASRRPYDLKLKDSDTEGYGDLAHFIDVLNNTGASQFAEQIGAVFDVNGFLRSLAVDVVTGSWDNYWYLKNNYYLYHNPRSGLFEYIPYDFDNSFGIWWEGIEGGLDWGTRNIYSWGSSEARPLTDRLFEVQAFVDRYTFFVEQLLDDGFDPPRITARIDSLRAQIATAAEADSFRTLDYGYSVQDFHDAFEQALGGHVTYGLKSYVQARHQSALSQLSPRPIRPILLDGYYEPVAPGAAEPVNFYVTVLDDQPGVSAQVEYELDGVAGVLPLFDDGTHGDEVAGDGKFSGRLEPTETAVRMTYRFVGRESAGRESFSNERILDIGYSGLPLYINELMASNDTTVSDAFGEYDDWVEIYNGSDSTISLDGLYLTDNLTRPDKFAAPDTTIAPGGFLIVWLDDNTEQGALHLPFKLSAGGEQFGIFDASLQIVDAVTFGEQQTDVSYGRTVDGGGRFEVLPSATPGASNVTMTSIDYGEATDRPEWIVQAYPNPFTDILRIRLEDQKSGLRVEPAYVDIFDALGRRVYTLELNGSNPATIELPMYPLAAGLYFVRAADRLGRTVATTSVVRK